MISFCHQTSHFFIGFIGEPAMQLNAFENGMEFDNVPITLEKYYMYLSVLQTNKNFKKQLKT
jgi:hypothetical protein